MSGKMEIIAVEVRKSGDTTKVEYTSVQVDHIEHVEFSTYAWVINGAVKSSYQLARAKVVIAGRTYWYEVALDVYDVIRHNKGWRREISHASVRNNLWYKRKNRLERLYYRVFKPMYEYETWHMERFVPVGGA